MSELEQFVADAIKTESKIEKISVNKELLIHTISILIDAGNILDQIKKHAFYDKAYDIDELMSRTLQMDDAISRMSQISTDDIVDVETDLEVNPRLFHAIVGIATESTELLEALNLDGKSMDNINIAEELGDLDWYKAIATDELGIEWITILETVIKKLKKRYPNAYTNEDAINRNLDQEREVLETMET